MRVFKTLLSIILICILNPAACQDKGKETWTAQENRYYKTLSGLAEYVSQRSKKEVSKDTLYSKYIYFDNVLNDTIAERRLKRIAIFDTIFSHIPNTIDSLGLQNIDAKPIRFYKENKIFDPFKKALSGTEKNVLVYYKKNNPEEPIGTLLFEEHSGKLMAWILLKQGDGAWFYLTFNLL